ncbi:MAG: hypothetical protein C5B58_14855 [Acidobacteria bacterium]|nr:MAG: hypothetical protein C5B58_14855 [Acidobacteriota bacterium]
MRLCWQDPSLFFRRYDKIAFSGWPLGTIAEMRPLVRERLRLYSAFLPTKDFKLEISNVQTQTALSNA